jgi:hypothetical protein
MGFFNGTKNLQIIFIETKLVDQLLDAFLINTESFDISVFFPKRHPTSTDIIWFYAEHF